MWQYLAEGKNHAIYSNGQDKILRVRKTENKKYYGDPLLYDEVKYNQLFFENVLMKNEVLRKYVQHSETIKVDRLFLEELEKCHLGEIDYDYQYA